MDLSISGFWTRRLKANGSPPPSALSGWEANVSTLASFIEPILSTREGDPESARILIVAAPGAVGKTTLAREIAHACRFAYVDLAKTSPLGGNFFTGGLANAFGLHAPVLASEGKLGLVVDALDEAQLRASPDGFTAGLNDIASIVRSTNALPVVLFGRSLVAEEAWLILTEIGVPAAEIAIEFFDDDRAQQYLKTKLRALSEQIPAVRNAFGNYRASFEDLALDVRNRLASAAGEDSQRFIGYAPVLDAICSFALDENELNPSARHLEGETQVDLIDAVSAAILLREQMKLQAQLYEQFPQDASQLSSLNLYGPDEQRSWLLYRIFSAPRPPVHNLARADLDTAYSEMIGHFLPHHPFLDGSGRAAANSVFGADILVWALRDGTNSQSVLKSLKRGPRNISGLLFDLYANRLRVDGATLPLEHVGILYESLKSQAGTGERATLDVVQDEGQEVPDIHFEILAFGVSNGPGRVYGPYSANDGSFLELQTPITGVFIDAPIWLEIGDGTSLQIEAPTFISVSAMAIVAGKVFAQANLLDPQLTEVSLLATTVDTTAVQEVVVSGATLTASWPNASAFPWTKYAGTLTTTGSPELDFMRRRLRRILTAFRSHSKGELVRYAPKIDDLRMTKDSRGAYLVERLIRDGVLSKFDAGIFYRLDPDRMGELLGMNYQALLKQQFTQRSDEYLLDVLRDLNQSTK